MNYKVVLNGVSQGVPIMNTFYYRVGIGIDVSAFGFSGAEALAQSFKSQVWGNSMRALMLSSYTLSSIDVYVIDDLFHLFYSVPYHLTVGEVGDNVASPYTIANCVNYRFVLEPLVGANILLGPRRGYVAIGPVSETATDPDGTLADALITNPTSTFNNFGNDITKNLVSVAPPIVFFPIRVRQIRNPLTGAPIWTGYADIQDYVIDPIVSFRRTRKQ